VDQEYSKRFYAFLAPAYDWVFGRTLEEGRREAARHVQHGEKVLEVGVGTGLGLRHYPSRCHVVGVDICPQMLRKARWRALIDGNGSRIDIKRMDATRLAFPDGCFDVVVAPYVITTVGAPDRMCAEMRRVCRQGGRVIVVSNTREAGLYGALKVSLSPLMEKVGFSTDVDVRYVLENAGLNVVAARRVNPLRIHKLFLTERA
jgi:phosphatidylethanolamine/phosphatidyl-N-methylethanolamine N-methyltransferase